MPCMCGDLYCHSCGPAQGNSRCEMCGAWYADGGCENPETCAKAAKEWCAAEAKELAEIEAAAKEFWAERDKGQHE